MRGGCLVFCEGVFGWGGFEIGVGRSNFKIGLGVGSGIEGADGANFEIGTPDPRLLFGWLAKSSNLDGLADQSKCLQNRGLVIGWPGLPVGAPRALRISVAVWIWAGLDASGPSGDLRSVFGAGSGDPRTEGWYEGKDAGCLMGLGFCVWGRACEFQNWPC